MIILLLACSNSFKICMMLQVVNHCFDRVVVLLIEFSF